VNYSLGILRVQKARHFDSQTRGVVFFHAEARRVFQPFLAISLLASEVMPALPLRAISLRCSGVMFAHLFFADALRCSGVILAFPLRTISLRCSEVLFVHLFFAAVLRCSGVLFAHIFFTAALRCPGVLFASRFRAISLRRSGVIVAQPFIAISLLASGVIITPSNSRAFQCANHQLMSATKEDPRIFCTNESAGWIRDSSDLKLMARDANSSSIFRASTTPTSNHPSSRRCVSNCL